LEVVYNGKIVGKFLDFADNGDYLIVLTRDGSKKVFLASECSIRCDNERRHRVTSGAIKTL
jgi:hypothetical protein